MGHSQTLEDMLLGDVRVPLSGDNRCVPEELLNDSQISPVPQQQRGNRVSQHMRRDSAFNAGGMGEAANDVENPLGRQSTSKPVQK